VTLFAARCAPAELRLVPELGLSLPSEQLRQPTARRSFPVASRVSRADYRAACSGRGKRHTGRVLSIHIAADEASFYLLAASRRRWATGRPLDSLREQQWRDRSPYPHPHASHFHLCGDLSLFLCQTSDSRDGSDHRVPLGMSPGSRLLYSRRRPVSGYHRRQPKGMKVLFPLQPTLIRSRC
jgi:hypothetical protein